MLAAVGGGVAAFVFYRQAGEEIRSRVESRLAQHYKGLKVSVRSAELVEGTGIRVRNLSILEPGAEGPCAELMTIEEMVLECPTEWQELIKGDPAVSRVTVRRPTLRTTHRPDGQWSSAKLLPLPQFGDHPPEVVVENGVVEIFDPMKAATNNLSLRDVNLSILPVLANAPLPISSERQGASAAGLPNAAGATFGVRPGMRRLQGMFASDGLRRVEFEGVIDVKKFAYSLRGRAETVDISPELRDSLPSPLAAKLTAIGGLRGQGNLQFQASYDAASGAPMQYNLSGRLRRGRLDDPRLPHTLSDMRATFHVDNGGYSIDDFAARSGQGTLRMACRRAGFEPTSPMTLSAEVRQLDLDRALLGILPQSLQDQWNKYRPVGEVDADIQVSFDGKTWRPEMSVQCLNVSFTHHKFPYRLEHGKGALDLKNDQLKLNITAYAGSQPVRLEAEFAHPFSGPTGWFEIKGDDIQLDEAMITALPDKPREVVRSLAPQGTLNFYTRLWRDKPDEATHQHLLLTANRCSIRYDKFPYPLSDIRGVLEMFDGAWTFRGLEANNDRARVTCEGRLTPGFTGNELVLDFTGKDVLLEASLRDALSPHMQRVWHDTRPRGSVDLTAQIRYLSEDKKFSVGVQIQPQRENASIEPVQFPYRLDHLEGTIVYRDGHVTFDRCKADHGNVKVSAAGYCDFSPDGRWNAHFSDLTADRLRVDRDRELLLALPERLRKAVVELNPVGSVNLRGSFDLARTGRLDEPLQSSWNMQLGMQQSKLQCGSILLENIHGNVTLQGGFDGQHLQTRGELAFDSVHYKDCQFTAVSGPIWIDDGRVLLGSWVDRRDNGVKNAENPTPARTPRPVTAGWLGGKFYLDGWATLEREPRYAINATLTEADLARCAKELAPGRQNLRGRILATADLTGSGRTRNNLIGRGTIRLSEANVYELPVMISLLKILSIRTPDQNAFSTATIDYRVEGEHIYFDRIDFQGDAISLRGKGEMDFQSNIRLTFYTTVGRGDVEIPIVKQVFTGASQQLMLIHIDGTLQNPETRKEVLPMLNRTIQGLGDEMQNLR